MAHFPIPQSVLDDSGVIGTWVHDHWAGQLVLLGDFPGLLGLDPGAAARGVPIEAFLDRTHPEDRLRIESYLHAAAGAGGPMEAEFRTRDSRGGARTIAMRGRFARDLSGRGAQGRGIAIDRTEERAVNLAQAERVVNRMAEHAIALRGLAGALRRPVLAERTEDLMIEIGRELARFLTAPGGEPRH